MKNYHVYPGPFQKSKSKTSNIMFNLLISLIPIICFNFYKNGIVPYINNNGTLLNMFYPLLFIFVGTFTTFITELIYVRIFLKKKNNDLEEYMKNSFSIFPGLFLSLILPINTSIFVLVMGCLFATVIGKMIFGGFGNNIFNPALVGWIFIIIYSNVIMSSSIKDFFIEINPLLCIIGFIYLVYKKVIKWKISILYIGTVFIMTLLIGSINNLDNWYPFSQIFGGGLFFGAIYMATDPVTSPVTDLGIIIYGICLGILTVFFKYLTPISYGVLISILTMNMVVFILDRIGIRTKNIKQKGVISIVSLIVIASFVSFIIADNFNKENIEETVYTVNQKGNGGFIKSQITINNTAIKIVKHNKIENYFKLVTNNEIL